MIHHDPNKIVHEWLDRCGHLNDPIRFIDQGKVIEGIFSGIDNLGNAKIKTDLGNRVYRSIY
jgi:biotin-(acetyl-CoA carboxylase) ligase